MAKIQERIKERRTALSITLLDIANELGVKEATVQRYESGEIRNIKHDIIVKIADILKCTPSYLMGWEEIDNTRKEKFDKILTRLPFYNDPVSAGGGVWLSEGNEYEWEDFEDVPNGADFALRVRGDSMSPKYEDGDIVFVKHGVYVDPWQVGIFVYDGEGYMKYFHGGKLVSENENYKPIPIGADDSFYTIGRVIGKAE